jgi:hypothetical protein
MGAPQADLKVRLYAYRLKVRLYNTEIVEAGL